MPKAKSKPTPPTPPMPLAQDRASKRDETRAVMNPVFAHSAMAEGFMKPLAGDRIDGGEAVIALIEDVKAVQGGDMKGPEAMLVSQAATLNAVFIELLRRSSANMGEHMNAMEMYMRLALGAQNQCRATLETLAAIKNPPVIYARQANFAAGPQQVNNGLPAPTRETDNPPNELLEAKHDGTRLDLGTLCETVGGNRELAAVGARDGAAHG